MRTGLRIPTLVATFALVASSLAVAQGTKPAPKTTKPPAKAAPPAKKAPAAVAPAPPPKPVPSDVRFASRYTTGDRVTDSLSFIKEQRERYELGDIILIKQRDQKRSIQISRAAAAYVIVPDAAPAIAPAAPKPPGVVTVTISIVDTGERKDAFGQTARRVRTVIERTPDPGACDQTKLLTVTDAWYIDVPKAIAASADTTSAAGGSGCLDDVKTTESGDPNLIGFPISYRTSLTDLADKESKAAESSMEVTAFEVLTLDAALFDIPEGLTAAADAAAFTKAISDANESKLARGAVEAGVPEKKPGTLRIGVPEFTNKATQSVDTRAMRSRIIAELEQQKIEAIPMAAAPRAELDARAKEMGVDYLLVAEITELKTSKPGGLTRAMRATAREESRDVTEAKVNVQLVPPGGKPRLAKNVSGKDGGIGLKTTLKVAKFAGSVYMRFYMGGMMGGQMSAYNSVNMMNIGGMGNMGAMMPIAPMGGGRIDRTAGAASFAMQQVMAGAALAATQQGGPSYDAALEGAIEDAGKDVVESIKRLPPVKQ